MVLKVFTVFDSKMESYMQPFLAQTRGQAIRSFEDTIADPQSMFARHPADFTLFEIGTYDDQKGEYSNLKAHESLGCAVEFVRKSEGPGAQMDLVHSIPKRG